MFFRFPLIRLLLLVPFLPFPLSAAVLRSPSQAAVDAAIACPLISYRKSFSGGAYTNGAWFGGASVTLAAASHAGNTSADARLLQQIRHSITGGNEICANGGYPAQHERHATGMFAIARLTPRIWDQLTAVEKHRVDLLMKAAFVASAFTTSDSNPFILAGIQQYSLDGDSNLNRDWNPNYREGMLGGVLVGMVYFGGPAAADAVLKNYQHAPFVAELAAQGLTNAHATFNWKAANPSLPGPTGQQIENALDAFKFQNRGLSDHTGIYNSLLQDTYGKNVNAGLNNGAGLNGGGMIYTGAETLPNPGAPGMLKEFASIDGGGPRSSLVYAYDGYRPHQTNQLVLIVGGYWPKESSAAAAAIARMKIGNTDLWYKIEKGYIDYSSGKNRGMNSTFATTYGFAYVGPLWTDVLLPYHEGATDPDLDSDGDGTPDEVEARLGLDPADGSSRFAMEITGGSIRWPGAAGVSFTIQRSTGAAGMTWETIATVPGAAGVNSFTDPNPPAGRAFYRIGVPR